jgi:hypothetical protein
MEDRAQPLRRFRESLMTTMHVSSVFDAGCDSRRAISHSALVPKQSRGVSVGVTQADTVTRFWETY